MKNINIDEQIILCCFNKPRYQSEITRMIYGNDWRNHKATVSTHVSQLIDKKYLDLTDYADSKKDGRSQQRKYYKSNIKAYLDYITTIISLEKDEIQILGEILDKNSFRQNIDYNKEFKSYKKINVFLQTAALGCQLVNAAIWDNLPSEYQKMTPQQWLENIHSKKNSFLKFSVDFDKKLEEQYQKNTPNTKTNKFTPKKFENLIEFRLDLIKLHDETIEKLKHLDRTDKRDIDFLINFNATLLDIQQ